MSDMSELYKVPSPEEVEALLRGDYTVDEPAPEQKGQVMEVGASENSPGGNSEVMEVGASENSPGGDRAAHSDRQTDDEITDLLPMDWADAIEVMARKFFDASVSAGTALDIYEFFNKCGVTDVEVEREQAYRESVRIIRQESNERIESLSKLITRLYLDLWYIEQTAGALMQLCDRYSPDELKAIASLITHQCMQSRTNISSHTETEHYPQIAIKRHERSTT